MAHNYIRNIRSIKITKSKISYTFTFKDSNEELKDSILLSSLAEVDKQAVIGYHKKGNIALLNNYVQYLANLTEDEIKANNISNSVEII